MTATGRGNARGNSELPQQMEEDYRVYRVDLPGYTIPPRQFPVLGSEIVPSSPIYAGLYIGLGGAVYSSPSILRP